MGMKQILVMMAALVLMGCGKKDEWPEFKTCERCKETDIKYWADVCKHCGKDPDGANGFQKRAELKKIWLEEKHAENENTSVRIEFYDPIVERVVRNQLKKPEGELTEADLESVRSLSLSETQITDAGLKEVAKLQKLEVLALDSTETTNEGLKEVTKLQRLQELYLNNTQITDAGPLRFVAGFLFIYPCACEEIHS